MILLTGTHSLQYLYTTVRGLNYPQFTAVGVVDGVQIVYYDSNINKLIPKTEWMKKFDDHENYSVTETENIQADENDFTVLLPKIMERFNHTEGEISYLLVSNLLFQLSE